MKTTFKRKLFVIGLMILVLGFTTMSFVGYQDNKPKPWKVPEASKKMKNAVKSDAASIAAGKTMYSKHCKSCHGSKGLGDGPKAKELDTECGNFSTAAFHGQTDGEIFYKIKEGRDDMPSFKKKIPDDEDIWNIVNFMRTLAK
jgi:mono/diheme cytochrome c family protein